MISSTVCNHPPPHPQPAVIGRNLLICAEIGGGGNTISTQSTVHPSPLLELKEWYLAITEKPTQQKKETKLQAKKASELMLLKRPDVSCSRPFYSSHSQCPASILKVNERF